MLDQVNDGMMDTAVFFVANAINLLLAGMFLARVQGLGRLAKILGWSAVALGLPVAVIALLNLLGGRAWWTVVLPALYVIYAFVQLLLDGILKVDFRHSKLLGPYLGLYYLGLLGLMGYSFGVEKVYGFVTLGTYLVALAATWYAYSRVGHGVAARREKENLA
ncbi:MAG TPA: hypothetical protein VLY63_05995 [Anaerolineae bacterium]|nr:hypothetical protein [Anaerolineae bacterium]